MTGPIRDTTGERIQDAFVESPTRANKTAVETVAYAPTEDLIYSENAGNLYVGTAPIGSLPSAAVWKIFRFNSSSGRISHASNSYNQIWNDRESLTYV